MNITQDGNKININISDRLSLSEISGYKKEIFSFFNEAKAGFNEIIINLSEISSVDSAGIGLLLNINGFAQEKDKTLILESVPDKIREILEIGGFHKYFKYR